MADRGALKFVGVVYGSVAMVVMLTAFLMVLRDVEAGVHHDGYGAPRAAIASVQ
jgi:hypothetical protein